MAPRVLLCLLLACASLLPSSSDAAESYDSCNYFIDSLPATAYQPGVWCLRKDLATSQVDGKAIAISGNGIVLDCNHFKVSGAGAGLATQAVGIDGSGSSGPAKDTIVRNCAVRGFAFGVKNISRVEDSRFDGNTVVAINNVGLVRRNRIVATGGSTVASSAVAIVAPGGVITDNIIDGVVPRADVSGSANAYGIHLTLDQTSGAIFGSTVMGNRLLGLESLGMGRSYALVVDSDERVVVRDNTLWAGSDQTRRSSGILCTGPRPWLSGNYVQKFGTGIQGCTTSDDVVVP